MELKTYIQLIKRNRSTFFLIWFAVVAFTLAWAWSRPVRYDVSVPVEVSREGNRTTADYQYDQYYRLQADEKFAETVSQWLKDPTVAATVLRAADQEPAVSSLRVLAKTFRAEKLAASFIQVRFQVSRPGNAEKMTEAIRQTLRDRTQAMNQQARVPDWFRLEVGTPTVVQAKLAPLLVMVAAMIGGVIVALLGISIIVYWKDPNQEE